MRALAGAMEGGTPSLQRTATLEAKRIRSLVSRFPTAQAPSTAPPPPRPATRGRRRPCPATPPSRGSRPAATPLLSPPLADRSAPLSLPPRGQKRPPVTPPSRTEAPPCHSPLADRRALLSLPPRGGVEKKRPRFFSEGGAALLHVGFPPPSGSAFQPVPSSSLLEGKSFGGPPSEKSEDAFLGGGSDRRALPSARGE